ncbi:MAG TPA: hypothetical protein VF832_06080 [Longimicrobiales bacterium]
MDIPPGEPSPAPASQSSLQDELAVIHQQISRATAAYQPNLLAHAADVCARAGENAQALSYYGQAIEGYLAGGRYHAASGVCRKILELSPGAVRAHCTHAWLALAREDTRHAVEEIRRYVQAARAAGQAQLATKQLVLLAQAAPRPVRESIGHELLALARSEESEAVVRSVFAAQSHSDTVEEPQDIWAQALYAVRLTPYDLAGKGSAPAAPTAAPAVAETLGDTLRRDPAIPQALRDVLERPNP